MSGYDVQNDTYSTMEYTAKDENGENLEIISEEEYYEEDEEDK